MAAAAEAAAREAAAAVPRPPATNLFMQALALPALMVRSVAQGVKAKGTGTCYALFLCGGQLGPRLLRLFCSFQSFSDVAPEIRGVTLYMRAANLFSLQLSTAGGTDTSAAWAQGYYAAARAQRAGEPAAEVLLQDPPSAAMASQQEAAEVQQATEEALVRVVEDAAAPNVLGPPSPGAAGVQQVQLLAAAEAAPDAQLGEPQAPAEAAAGGQQAQPLAAAEAAAGAVAEGVEQPVELDRGSVEVEASSVPPQHG